MASHGVESTFQVPKESISHHEREKTTVFFCVFTYFLLKTSIFSFVETQLFLSLQLRALTKRYPVPGEDGKALYETIALLKFDNGRV